MPTPIIRLEDHRRRTPKRGPSKDVSGAVLCPRCRRPIPAASTTCPECGVHFQGWAEDFARSRLSFLRTNTGRSVLLVAAVLLMLVMLRALLGPAK